MLSMPVKSAKVMHTCSLGITMQQDHHMKRSFIDAVQHALCGLNISTCCIMQFSYVLYFMWNIFVYLSKIAPFIFHFDISSIDIYLCKVAIDAFLTYKSDNNRRDFNTMPSIWTVANKNQRVHYECERFFFAVHSIEIVADLNRKTMFASVNAMDWFKGKFVYVLPKNLT